MAKKKTKSERPGRTKYDVTPAQFVAIWQTSETVQEVSDKLKMPEPIILARACSYRKAGVRLKKLKRKRKPGVDVDALNRLIDQIAEGETPEQVLGTSDQNADQRSSKDTKIETNSLPTVGKGGKRRKARD
jgi:hypothetical protein